MFVLDPIDKIFNSITNFKEEALTILETLVVKLPPQERDLECKTLLKVAMRMFFPADDNHQPAIPGDCVAVRRCTRGPWMTSLPCVFASATPRAHSSCMCQRWCAPPRGAASTPSGVFAETIVSGPKHQKKASARNGPATRGHFQSRSFAESTCTLRNALTLTDKLEEL